MTDDPNARELAREIAHRLNNQLTALYGQIDMLSMESTDAATVGRIGPIRDVAERIASISRELQSYGRDEPAPAVAAPPEAAAILVIEDDTAILAIAVNVLTAMGYQVLATSSGEEAEAMVASPDVEVDLILTDVGLPGRLGPETVDRIRAQRPDVRVIFATGDADRAVRQVPSLEGIPLLHKPYRRVDLARAVADALAV